MLVQFTVENFGSIKELVTFSMLASSDKSNIDNTYMPEIFNKKKKDNRLLKFASIYGPNASGKSTLLRAISFLKNLVLFSHLFQEGSNIPVEVFKLDKECELKPSFFEIIFIKNNINFTYSVKLNKTKVIEEYLYANKKLIFKRENTTKFEFNFSKDKKNKSQESEKEKLREEIFTEMTLENALFLSHIPKTKNLIAQYAFDWFKVDLNLLSNHSGYKGFTEDLIKKTPDVKILIENYLKFADVGIIDFNVQSKELDDSKKQFSAEFRKLVFKHLKSTKNLLDKEPKESQDQEYYDEVKTFHKGIDTEKNAVVIEFDIFEESDGTQKYFEIIGPLIDVLNNGYIIFIDELDARLHPNLTKELISLFNDNKVNSKNAQLIFTTHDVNLLNLNLFRRDQIWFTNKNDFGITDLYSLSDFSVRKDVDIKKGYLSGRFNAIPFIDKDLIKCQK